MSKLGRKANIANDDWLAAAASIETVITAEEVEKKAAKTIREIKATVKGKRSAYAWSGGKDSIALGHICARAGVTSSLIGVCDLEYPAFLAWVEENKPQGCEVVNTGQGLAWLAAHPEMLFPQTAAVAARWFSIVQHKAQRQYYKAQNMDILVLGRRRADGNFVGRGTNCYTDGKGVTRYSPLADWTHEELLGYIHYNKLALPPIYGWPNGYKCGTHPWPARQWTGSEANGWAEVYSIDPGIVTEAAEHIPGAANFLQEVAR